MLLRHCRVKDAHALLHLAGECAEPALCDGDVGKLRVANCRGWRHSQEPIELPRSSHQTVTIRPETSSAPQRKEVVFDGHEKPDQRDEAVQSGLIRALV